MCAAEDSFITSNNNKHKGKPSHSFTGSELLSWLVENGEAKNRTEALDLGEQLMKVGILRNGMLLPGYVC